ncbi:MAG: PxxKW family cysteine-rich protein [Deltaproteobacteria bacterium]|jgi:hypothetical protein|nr:PxxKW family cysteine-rich protein [Deltaproteobacteria bacterium]
MPERTLHRERCVMNDLAVQAIAEKCVGCDRIKTVGERQLCSAFPVPSVKWRLGNCNMATHIKTETRTTEKVRVGQQKQKKK